MTSPLTYTGRVYCRNLPKWWTEDDVSSWLTSLHLPAPASCKLWKKEHADQASAYVHWSKVTNGQLETYTEHMSREWLTHKQVVACVSAPTELPTASTPATTHAQAADPLENAPWRVHRKRKKLTLEEEARLKWIT